MNREKKKKGKKKKKKSDFIRKKHFQKETWCIRNQLYSGQ